MSAMRVLITETLARDPMMISALHRLVPGLDVMVWPECGSLVDAELLVSWQIPDEFARLPGGVKAVFCYGAGTDRILDDSRVPADLPVMRLIDPGQADRMLDYAMAAAFHHLNRLSEYRQLQAERRWAPVPLDVATRKDLRITVLGLGRIGARVAVGLAESGFSVRGWSRTHYTLAGVDTFAGDSGFGPASADADLLINILPAHPSLHRIIDAGTLSRLAKGALLVNVGRGEHVDLDALRTALECHLSSAWLDVFEDEPLDQEHWAWSHSKIVLTPHSAAVPTADGAARSLAAAILALRGGAALPGLVRGVDPANSGVS